MNWLALLSGVFKLIPYVVAGIETIHANESTQTKTQLAGDALNIATAAAGQVLTGQDAQIAQIVSSAVGAGIQSTQAILSTLATPAPASVPVTAPAPAPVSQTDNLTWLSQQQAK